MTSYRLPAPDAGTIAAGRDGERLEFCFDGRPHTGVRGDTLASALLAAGIMRVADSIHRGRPRGIYAAGVEEPNALVEVAGHGTMLTASTVELFDGLRARSLPGRGRLEPEDPSVRYDKMHAHCDVLIVGGGPAGLLAALRCGRAGARTILCEEGAELGGGLLGGRDRLDDAPAADWIAGADKELRSLAHVRVLTRTTVFGAFGSGEFMALERRTEHLGPHAPAHVSRQRVWQIHAARTILATGAHERSVALAGNDRPGVMLGGAARTYVNRHGVAPGERAVVFTTNDSSYAAAIDLADSGIEVAAVVDPRPAPGAASALACRARGIELLSRHVVARVLGEPTTRAVQIGPLDAPASPARTVECDLVLISGGWNPAVQLFSQAGGSLRYDQACGAFVPAAAPDGVTVAGSLCGLASTRACLADGVRAAQEVLDALGLPVPEDELPAAEEPVAAAPATLWLVADPGPDEPWTTHFVDLQRDVTVADVAHAHAAGMRSVEHVKRHTTAGTAHDQGRTAGPIVSGVLAQLMATTVEALGTTTFRAPYVPVSFAALAGRNRGELHDPVRTTAIHDWHVAHGALFEDVGQWKRPWYFPRPGEDMAAAVDRECRAARAGVALMDASTLGKIDIQGPDAAEFLDRIYTNVMSSLAVGSIRYGVMCRPDGMVFDDGTAIRLAEDRYLITTTTGGAAAVLEWLEEWLQTEWPHLRVYCTSVTDQWSTAALVGPRSREVLSGLAPDLDIDNDSFPCMAWRETRVAGVEALVCRISFSGELAYEVNTAAWHGPHVWEALVTAGAPHGLTPYGTETMHVLRAEKGYVIVGQDTDGTVTPQDLGMNWIVSKKKEDFLGKRSFARADTSRGDRKQLVGLLPLEAGLLLREGTQLVEAPELRAGVPMLGHVTSSYRSATLGRTFALALLRGGHARHGQTVHAVVGDRAVAVGVTAPIFYDKEGARRDG